MLLYDLGDELTNWRLKRKMTQFQIAEKAHIHEKHYGRIERGESLNVTIITLMNICNALQIKPEIVLKKINRTN